MKKTKKKLLIVLASLICIYSLTIFSISYYNHRIKSNSDKNESLTENSINDLKGSDTSYENAESTVNEFLAKYQLDEAETFVQTLSETYPNDPKLKGLQKKLNEFTAMYDNLVLYKGAVEHVFTHCLIAFSELCYSSPSMTASLDTDCLTAHEFKLILENLYEKDYILIDINMLYEQSDDGSVKLAALMLPEGKKPLVFSIDDVTYDSRKMSTGMVDKLIVDNNGRTCTYTKHKSGEEIISYDNEVFPILEQFVREHPDFSFKGARGTLCLTGFEGIFGYRTQSGTSDDIDYETERQGALSVSKALKEEGWNFASHSYGHGHMDAASTKTITNDTNNWQDEVASIVGSTKIFVWPYGGSVRSGESYDVIYNAGFRLFCGVGSDPYLVQESNGLSIFMDRKALDGYSLRNRRDRYMYLFDTLEVWDPLRPKEVTW